MSLIKGKQEFRTILDFSTSDISKNRIKQSLRQTEVLELIQHEGSSVYTLIENDIIVGMYQIRLFFNHRECTQSRTRLREYGGFRIAIYERNRKGTVLQNINLNKDSRFKNESWVTLNNNHNLHSKDLVDIIMLLQRLNNLKMFL
jgi:hypothetical protein